ncbi:MAG: methionine adenosyltransferase [Candidatus Cloacimonadaceae bacterium]|nr:methionine adenosyltransferase [Candidatus Cloacimonadota bacterium]MDX9949310.1 methionine adenosyltransferase [Candidatus Syntrophosphaera sp.]
MTALHAAVPCDKNEYVFTSESVSEGHPDKVCDQISDAILDAYLKEDPLARVACETLATTNRVVLSGEVSTSGDIKLDVESIVRKVISDIGYVVPNLGFDAKTCVIENLLHAQTVELQTNEGAGDQGLMFGYACNQTKFSMPVPIAMSHLLMQNLAKARKDGQIPGLLPDSKSQVSLRYCGRRPSSLETVVISTHHLHKNPAEFAEMKRMIEKLVIKPTVEEMESDSCSSFHAADYRIMINPRGMWENGGPAADTGLTGRKIIVDTYGGWAQHGGGAFSGKDATKVDRSATYMTRHIAKSVVESGLAAECLVQLSFVIGESEPVSLMAETFGSGRIGDQELEKLIRDSFPLTVKGIIEYLDLRRPIFLPTAAYGHFGREEPNFTWEKTKALK